MAAESNVLRESGSWRSSRRLWIVAVLAMLTLTGCSLRKLAYSWAGKILVSRFVDTFDLNGDQKRDLLPRVAALHEWHRKTELPRYVEFIDAVIGKAQDGFDRSEVEWMLSASFPIFERLSARFSPEAAAVLATCSDAQIDHAIAEFRKAEKERFEKLELSEDEYVKHRMKQARKNMKTWLGSYSDAQLEAYERFARKNRVEELRRRTRYRDNQLALLNLMRTHPGPQPIADAVHRWLTRLEVQPTPEYQEAEKRSQADFVDLVLTIDRLMSPEQRRHLIDELKGWRSDFSDLVSG
jgi:hypothetical protein